MLVREIIESVFNEREKMDILFLCVISGLIVAGGLWVASRDTKPVANHDDKQHHPV